MSIDKLPDESIKNMINNYEAKGVTTGGPYPLDALWRELRKRAAGPLDLDMTFNTIVDLAKENQQNTTTYGALWEKLSPGRPWAGHSTQQTLGKALGGVVARCIERELPILTVLVLPQSGPITKKAKENIYEECIKLGMKIRLTPDEFYSEQFEKSRFYIRKLLGNHGSN